MAQEDHRNMPDTGTFHNAVEFNENGLQYFGQWELEKAIESFRDATNGDPENPEYHLNLARAYARSGNYQEAMRSLGEYLRTETDEDVAARYERLFSSALDSVEEILIEKMRELEMPLPQIGKGIQMWLEYRITLGRKPLHIQQPELWAAGLAYAVVKINLVEMSPGQIAGTFDVSERALREIYLELVSTLDLMPADYRYFTGEENPLDKLVEAAQLLEEIYGRFHEA